ncbi:MAG: HAD family hydrolase [Spirochaetia bacterium]|nr:HAD family hydrolase [Spirochaetia bacterium]
MRIVVDMDNTLTDEFGSTARPGIHDFLKSLLKSEHELILWTNSTAERARTIIAEHELRNYFNTFIFREDYDPQNTGKHKDIGSVSADIIIDDDPQEIKAAQHSKKIGILISPFRKGGKVQKAELANIKAQIDKASQKKWRLF